MSKTILVTAGPTREKLDPVRFISNESTGTLGYEIAKQLHKKGHRVIFLKGPIVFPSIDGVEEKQFESASDLKALLDQYFEQVDVLFMTSAVADYRPKAVQKEKLRRQDHLELQLEATEDILASLGHSDKRADKLLVGFCLETGALEENAARKLKSKNLDYIVGTLYETDAPPFGDSGMNSILMERGGDVVQMTDGAKSEFAAQLIDKLSL